jgi:hypothetical protein
MSNTFSKNTSYIMIDGMVLNMTSLTSGKTTFCDRCKQRTSRIDIAVQV